MKLLLFVGTILVIQFASAKCLMTTLCIEKTDPTFWRHDSPTFKNKNERNDYMDRQYDSQECAMIGTKIPNEIIHRINFREKIDKKSLSKNNVWNKFCKSEVIGEFVERTCDLEPRKVKNNRIQLNCTQLEEAQARYKEANEGCNEDRKNIAASFINRYEGFCEDSPMVVK